MIRPGIAVGVGIAIAALAATAQADPDIALQPVARPLPPSAFSAALAVGIGETGLPIDGDGSSDWAPGSLLDGELGFRFERVGLALFGRWVHTPSNIIYNDGPGQYAVHMSDFDAGVRFHVWPSRHRLRLTLGVGGTVHHETDTIVPPFVPGNYGVRPDGKISSDSFFIQGQIGVVVWRPRGVDLEVAGDVETSPLGGPALGLTIGARL